MNYFSAEPTTEIGHPPRKWQSLIMSLVAHTLLGIFLILCCFSDNKNQSPEKTRVASIVLTVEDENSPTEYLEETDVVKQLDDVAEPVPAAAATALDTAPPMNLTAIEVPNRPGMAPVESLVFDASGMSNVPARPRSKREFQLSKKDLALIEADRKLIRSRMPVGEPTTINVFGSGSLTGRDFVFVIDRSHSMGSGGLGVIHASRKELSIAINQLQPNHKFQIVGYHDNSVTMSTRNMLPATDENKRDVANFIGELAAYGGTNHEGGLVTGLAFRPDVIVFMTDGGYPELNATKLKMVQKWAGTKTQIHCVQFGAGPIQKKINFMTKMAAQNNGSYRYINVNKWK